MTETELTDVERDRERIRALQLERSTTLRARLMRWRARRKQSSLEVTDDLEAAKADDNDTGFSRMIAGVAMTGPIRVQRGAEAGSEVASRTPRAWEFLLVIFVLAYDAMTMCADSDRSKTTGARVDQRRARSLCRHEERRLRALSRSMYGRYGR